MQARTPLTIALAATSLLVGTAGSASAWPVSNPACGYFVTLGNNQNVIVIKALKPGLVGGRWLIMDRLSGEWRSQWINPQGYGLGHFPGVVRTYVSARVTTSTSVYICAPIPAEF